MLVFLNRFFTIYLALNIHLAWATDYFQNEASKANASLKSNTHPEYVLNYIESNYQASVNDKGLALS